MSLSEPSLVLGSDGFVGRNLVRWMDVRGYPYVAIGRSAGDLSQPGVAEAAFKAARPCARVFHLVTRQRTGAVQLALQGELLAINARLHLNVLEAWRLHQPQAKLIAPGSSCTYPESASATPETLFGASGAHPSVVGYACAKTVLATGLQVYGQQYGLKWLNAIFATLYGPYDHAAPDRSHFMGALITRALAEKAQGARRFTVWGSPDVVRELLYVDDQIEALMAADAAFENRVLNVAANLPVTIGEAARAILDALQWDVALDHPQGSFSGASFKMLDSSIFLKQTGWKPRMSLADGIRATVAAEQG
jgi:GDP-L-fucose synthase